MTSRWRTDKDVFIQLLNTKAFIIHIQYLGNQGYSNLPLKKGIFVIVKFRIAKQVERWPI